MKPIARLYCGFRGPRGVDQSYEWRRPGPRIMRIGIRLAISALVLASILVSVGAVHALWWRTAEANSRELASTINQQIVAAVEQAIAADAPLWFDVSNHANGVHPAIAYAGPIDVYQQRQGVLAVVIEHARLSRFLSELSVGKTGAAFILGPGGSTIAVPDPEADELRMQHAAGQPLLEVARLAARKPDPAQGAQPRMRAMREVMSGESYAVSLTPLAFP